MTTTSKATDITIAVSITIQVVSNIYISKDRDSVAKSDIVGFIESKNDIFHDENCDSDNDSERSLNNDDKNNDNSESSRDDDDEIK